MRQRERGKERESGGDKSSEQAQDVATTGYTRSVVYCLLLSTVRLLDCMRIGIWLYTWLQRDCFPSRTCGISLRRSVRKYASCDGDAKSSLRGEKDRERARKRKGEGKTERKPVSIIQSQLSLSAIKRQKIASKRGKTAFTTRAMFTVLRARACDLLLQGKSSLDTVHWDKNLIFLTGILIGKDYSWKNYFYNKHHICYNKYTHIAITTFFLELQEDIVETENLMFKSL